MLAECCVHSCDGCPDNTVITEDDITYCCSNCAAGGAVTVAYNGCFCDRTRELSLLAGIPSDPDACIDGASGMSSPSLQFLLCLIVMIFSLQKLIES